MRRLQEFDEAVRLNDGYVEAHFNRAITLNELGRYDEAHRSFERAGRFETEIEAAVPGADFRAARERHMSLGDLYLEAVRRTQAAEQYRTALTMRPRFHDIRNKLAQALLQLGDLDAASAELETVLAGKSAIPGGAPQPRAGALPPR